MEVMITECRLLWPNLFDARAPKQNPTGPKKLTACLVFDDKETAVEIHQAIMAALTDKFGKQQAEKIAKSKGRFYPLKKCEDAPNETLASFDGYYINVSANEDYPPAVVDQKVKPVMDRNAIYSGCYVNAKINAWCWDNNGKGASIGLLGVQLVRDGERVGSAGGTAGFEPVAFGDDDDDDDNRGGAAVGEDAVDLDSIL